jgi:GNAT superfamily N-acetyltransferase
MSEEQVKEYTKTNFGRELTREDIALVSGALPGSRVTVHESTSYESESEKILAVNVELMGDDGFPIGYMRRQVKYDSIYNSEFFLDKGFRGKGLGLNAFSQQVEEATSRGFRKLETTAEGAADLPDDMNGYSTWAKFGYDGKLKYDPGPNGERTIHEVMSTKEGRSWWEKNGYEFEGTFSLLPGSASRRVFDEYRRLKSKV